MIVGRAELSEALLTASPDAVVVVGVSGTIEMASPAIERLLGYRPEDVVGQPVEVLIPQTLRAVHTDHRHHFMDRPVARTMGSGLALSARRADGSTMPVDVSLVPVVIDDIQLVGAFIRDVTERRRNEDLSNYVNEIASALLRGGPTVDTLTLTAERARTLAGAEAAWVMVPTGGDEFFVPAADGRGVETLVDSHLAVEGSISAHVLTKGSLVAIPNMSADPAVLPEARELGFGPGLYLPLSDDEVIGVLVVARAAGGEEFEPALTSSLEVFASAAAIVLSLGRARSELETLRQIAEHERIARDLHDTVIQRLFAIGMSLQALQPLVNASVSERLSQEVDAVDRVIGEIRETIFSLARRSRGGPDIRQQLRRVVAEASESLGFTPRVGFKGPVEAATTAEVAGHLLAVTTEALSNVIRHAQARRVEVLLEARDVSLTLTISDDGIGMTTMPSAGHGLENMYSRAQLLGGELRLSAGPEAGTLLQWRVPIDRGKGA